MEYLVTYFEKRNYWISRDMNKIILKLHIFWTAKILNLTQNNKWTLPFDTERDNDTIKQADTLMLGYPLNWNMSRDILKNDLEYYENKMSTRTPAMTYSFMAVGWKFAEKESEMFGAFEKSYNDYMRQPFKVYTIFVSL